MEDRISTLPSNIIELILMYLPIEEAVRTSILSSRWRYQWCTIPHLIFDKSISLAIKYKLENVVDQVLLLHSGPIHKFSFEANSGIEDIAPIDRWLVFLSRNNLKELALKFNVSIMYKLPTALYSCQAMVSLDLHDCEVKLPRSFNGFGCLTVLLLENISISESDFASLISKCPLLRKLVFIDFYCCFHLKLNAPRLRELVVEGVFADIYLEHTPDLASLSLGLEDDDDEELDNEDEDFENGDAENEEECDFNKCLTNIPKIEKLELQQNFLDFMTRGNAFVRFPIYNCLKKVFLTCFNFEDLKHVMVLQSLLQNTPVLNELELEADSDESIATIPTSSFFDKKESCHFRLYQLRNVRLTELVGVRAEVEFIEFILSCASRLESLTIKLDGEAPEEIKVYKEIMRFRRASNRAEVVILD